MREWLQLRLLVAAQFVVMLDTAVVNVALPSVGAGLGLDPVGTAWVLNAYFLVFGGMLLVAGRAADVLGRRRMYVAGAALLLIGAVVGLFAVSAAAVFAARILQAVGAAALSPAAMSMILSRTDGAVRLRAMSHWGAASTIGGAVGVAVGGMVAAAVGWHAIFAITATAAASLLLLGLRWLPRDDGGARRGFDAAGAALATGVAVALSFAILSIPQHGWWSVPVLGGLLAGLGLALILVAQERRAADPIFPQRIIATPRVLIGLAVNLLGGASRIAAFVLVAFLLQRVLGMGIGAAGTAMLPTSVVGFVVSVVVLPKMLQRFGPERLVALGCLVLAGAHVLLAHVSPESSYAVQVLPALALAAVGVAMSFTPTALVLAKEIAKRDAGVGSALASASAQLGGLLGIAVFGAVDAIVNAAGGRAGAHAVVGASGSSLSEVFLVAAGFAACAAALTLLGLVRHERPSEPSRSPAAPALSARSGERR